MEPTHHPIGRARADGAATPDAATIPRARPLSMEKVILLRDQVRPLRVPRRRARRSRWRSGSTSARSAPTSSSSTARGGSCGRSTPARRPARSRWSRRRSHELRARAGRPRAGRRGGHDRLGARADRRAGRRRHDQRRDHGPQDRRRPSSPAPCSTATVETIFEIGGQDAKYIRIEDGIVVDFAMNEACAAGTGSFLEERAEELGVCIKGEFAERALRFDDPGAPRRALHRLHGAGRQRLAAAGRRAPTTSWPGSPSRWPPTTSTGWCAGGRSTGTIFFQGGTAYNDAVAAAFAQILEREIVVPPYNGVVGRDRRGPPRLGEGRRPSTPARASAAGISAPSTTGSASSPAGLREPLRHAGVHASRGRRPSGATSAATATAAAPRSEFHPVIDDLVRRRREWLLDGYEPGPGRRATAVHAARALLPRPVPLLERLLPRARLRRAPHPGDQPGHRPRRGSRPRWPSRASRSRWRTGTWPRRWRMDGRLRLPPELRQRRGDAPRDPELLLPLGDDAARSWSRRPTAFEADAGADPPPAGPLPRRTPGAWPRPLHAALKKYGVRRRRGGAGPGRGRGGPGSLPRPDPRGGARGAGDAWTPPASRRCCWSDGRTISSIRW